MPETDTIDQISVVLVTFRSRQHVVDLLGGWPRDLEVVVVDNSADTDGVRAVVEEHPNARYVDGGGQGFARAANLGVRHATRPFVVFVNPDCRPSATQLTALVDGLGADPGAVAHAATMTSEGGIEAGVAGWEPSPGRLLVHALGLSVVLRRSGLFARPLPGERTRVDWVTGACMAVRREQFEEVGRFDDAFYVYAEDVGFGRQARARGLRTVLREDVLVPHGAGASGAPSKEMLRLRGASFAGYLTRYHRRSALLMRALMVLGSVVRLPLVLVRQGPTGARTSAAFVTGLVTRRAYVGGTEVAARRYRETEPILP